MVMIKRCILILFLTSQAQSGLQPPEPKKPRNKTTLIVTSSLGPAHSSSSAATEQRTLRRSTQEISRGFRKRREEEEEVRRHRRVVRRPKQARKLTQEELLEEAKWTEIENLASLDAYARMEEEKKKVKEKKVVWMGPVVRYLSLTMPVVSDADSAEKDGSRENKLIVEVEKCDNTTDSSIAMETDTPAPDKSTESASQDPSAEKSIQEASPKPHPPPPPSEQKQCRNFMVFTDTNNFPSAYFPPPPLRPPRPRRRFCPVTGLPAKYIDPLTRTPYATPFAFKVIRMRYVSEAEEKCEKRLIQLSNWLEEKKKKKMESS